MAVEFELEEGMSARWNGRVWGSGRGNREFAVANSWKLLVHMVVGTPVLQFCAESGDIYPKFD